MPAIPSDTLIALRGAGVRFWRTEALAGVDLEVEAGDFLGVVGPSGSGKTSLLRLMQGTLRPSAGTCVRLPGLVAGYLPQIEQMNAAFPVSVEEVVLMAAGRRALPWPSRAERRRAMDLLERMGVAHLAREPLLGLSGGQRQRVFIARAMMAGPQLLLLDEPASAVDVAARHDVLHLLHDLNHSEGVAVVVTTHDLNGIAAHMHRLVCLNRTVIAAGAPGAILTPEVLERTYGAPMEVLSHGGMPVVVEGLEAFPAPHHSHHPRRKAATPPQ